MNTSDQPYLVAILVGLAVLLVVFLIIRELVCWYWKINQTISLLTEIRDLLASKGSASGSSAARTGSSGSQVNELREPTL